MRKTSSLFESGANGKGVATLISYCSYYLLGVDGKYAKPLITLLSNKGLETEHHCTLPYLFSLSACGWVCWVPGGASPRSAADLVCRLRRLSAFVSRFVRCL